MIGYLIDDKNICTLDSTEKYEAIKELTRKASVFSSMSDLPRFQEGVIKREREMSTGIGKGIAVAHGDCPENDQIKIALGISRKGINFDAIDNEPVHIMFLIANPPGTWMEYLNILASIVRMVRNETLRRSLLSHYNPEKLYSFLRSNLCTG